MLRRRSFAQQRLHDELRSFLRVNAVMLATVAAFFLCLAVALAQFVHGYVLGAVHTALVLVYVGMLLAVFVGVTGSMNLVAGTWGEDNTRETLRKAKRRRIIRGWVDNLEVQGGDVDHLIVLRDGTALAIDSKYHSTALTDDLLERDVAKARIAARRASLILRSEKLPQHVTPLVVEWGGVVSRLRGSTRSVDGVDVVAGPDLMAWLRGHAGARAAGSEPDLCLRTLERFKHRVQPPVAPMVAVRR